MMKHRNIAAMFIGFGLDAVLGDPHGWPHLVKLVGKQIEFEEGLVRDYLLPEAEKLRASAGANAGAPAKASASVAAGSGVGASAPGGWPLDRAQTERLAGAALAADVALVIPGALWLVLRACDKVHPALALAVESAACYQLLAARSLRDESSAVQRELEAGDLPAARKAVAMIVGRDTDRLDEQGVARAAVETVAENASDGVVAPLLFMGLGGAPAAMLYKAVNTLDSMVGYKNERYLNLGWAGAKLDDLLNIVPSRATGGLMCAAARLTGMNPQRAWATYLRDRNNHTSPNSAQAEAACAGALGVQLGGGNYYFGEYVDKPTIGDATRPVEAADIERANKLMYATAVLGLGAATVVGLFSKSSKGPKSPAVSRGRKAAKGGNGR